ncbi:Nucleus-vacuole junction protein 2 [Frankliniella fusca]|uniref:Nucleus-vacuole junction protein 2 n=1 Tax=Frankliniella fusca TaxID=407009 RepID=A0AAE1H9Y7_9NEOP|nr:Nucleus-vacuole junction protein 2 [Frankliniella fusca]
MKILQGTIHQGNHILFPKYHGVQCCATSVVACAHAMVHDPDLWTPKDIDACVHVGTDLHSQSKPSKHTYLFPHEVHKTIVLPNQNVLSLIADDKAKFVGPIHDIQYFGDDFSCALTSFFESSRFGILTCEQYSFGMIRSKSDYWIFDSHAKNEIGKTSNEGKAVLMKFDCINEIVLYYRSAFDRSSSYSITEISFKHCVSQPTKDTSNQCAENTHDLNKPKKRKHKVSEYILPQPLGDSLNRPAENVLSLKGGNHNRPEKRIKQSNEKVTTCLNTQPLGDSLNRPAENVLSLKGGNHNRPEKRIKQIKEKVSTCLNTQPLGDSLSRPAENVHSLKGGNHNRPEKRFKQSNEKVITYLNTQPSGDLLNRPAENVLSFERGNIQQTEEKINQNLSDLQTRLKSGKNKNQSKKKH